MYRSLDGFINEKEKSNPDLNRELDELSNYTDLALRIHDLRNAVGMSQRELADKIGTSQANVVRWETPGYTSYTVKSLEKLSRVLGAALRIDLVTPEVNVSNPYITNFTTEWSASLDVKQITTGTLYATSHQGGAT